MLAALTALLVAAGNAPVAHDARPVVALLPLRALGVPTDVVQALQVTLHNELSALAEARLVPEKEIAEALRREPDCASRIPCAALAASRAGARQLIMGTVSQLGDAFMIDLKLLDARSAQELRRATHPVSGSEDALIDTLRESAVQLLAPARYAGSVHIDVPGVNGALLFVDGKEVGTTPLAHSVEGLSPGPHTVRVVGNAQEASAFVDVRFGQVTDARIDLKSGALELPAAAMPVAQTQAPAQRTWVRPAALTGLALGAVSLIAAVAFQARAYATAGDLNRREALNELQPGDAAAYQDVDRDTHLARGFYVSAAVFTVAGAGLWYWDARANGFRF